IQLVRSVEIDLHQSWFDVVLDDEVRRRLTLGPGTYLPWEPGERARALTREKRRIEEYLHDEGFFDAAAQLALTGTDRGGARLAIDIWLGPSYTVGAIGVDTGGGLAVSPAEIRAMFRHRPCLVWKLCLGPSRFTRAQLQRDLERVT